MSSRKSDRWRLLCAASVPQVFNSNGGWPPTGTRTPHTAHAHAHRAGAAPWALHGAAHGRGRATWSHFECGQKASPPEVLLPSHLALPRVSSSSRASLLPGHGHCLTVLAGYCTVLFRRVLCFFAAPRERRVAGQARAASRLRRAPQISRPRLTNRLLANPGTPGILRERCRVCVSAESLVIGVVC